MDLILKLVLKVRDALAKSLLAVKGIATELSKGLLDALGAGVDVLSQLVVAKSKAADGTDEKPGEPGAHGGPALDGLDRLRGGCRGEAADGSRGH
eukprot:CAMPEP_0171506810 /NCGR_PEP_ID=MMETSP0958-20121227/13144_1 /TAXON_ID=87120 /ORGANISM="Aurantiochytrium limacinum, Strain ATCCMYA-1381" /LENGTH=94 /DNA_ID=CAMNT_0012043425 /DNA_START=1131 /DNA_END=1415 /DNA_ORIENTATION=-